MLPPIPLALDYKISQSFANEFPGKTPLISSAGPIWPDLALHGSTATIGHQRRRRENRSFFFRWLRIAQAGILHLGVLRFDFNPRIPELLFFLVFRL
jgi:hypothetical protein